MPMIYQKFWLRLLNTIIFLLLTGHLFGQNEYVSRTFTLQDGLSSEQCRDMHKDRAGFLWISTDKGLNRFDGNSFYTFRHRPDDPLSIGSNSCNGLLEDRTGRLWINTDEGLSLFNRKTQTFTNYAPDTTILSIPGISYTEMEEDLEGRIWIGGYYDVLIFNPVNQKFEKSGWYDFAKQSGIIKEEKRNSITQSIIKKSETELWLLTVYGLFSVHTATKTFTYHPNPGVDDYFAFSIRCKDSKGVLWIGTYDQCFFSYDPTSEKWTHHVCPPREKEWSDMMLAINEYNENTLLMTRTDSIFVYHKYTKKWDRFLPVANITNLSSLSYTNTMLSGNDLFIFADGIIPFIQLSKKKKYIHKIKIPLPSNFINNHSYKTPDGKVLTGDWNKNLILVCDAVGCVPLKEPDNNHQLGALQLFYVSQNGQRYISTSNKVYQWNVANNIVNLISKEDDNQKVEFRNFVEDTKGNIYVRERNKGIFILKKGKSTLEHFECGMESGDFSALYFDRKSGKLWLGSEKKGLFIIDPAARTNKQYSLKHLAGSNKGMISDISGDEDGNVFLLVSKRGLVKINSMDMVPKLYTSLDGLNSDAVKYGCVLQNKYWFTSESGLMTYDYHNQRFYSFEREGESKLFNYRIFPDEEGNIIQNLFPDHIITMNKSIVDELQLPPQIYLKEVKLSGKIIPHDSVFTTAYDRNNFVFLFGNIGQTGLNQKEFLYNINGQSWQSLENSVISLYNLSPGDYYIRVCHAYDLKNCFSLKIFVVPPWWKTNWFLAFMFIVLFIIVYGLYRKRVASVRQEEFEKNQLKQRIAEIEMTALRAQMNPHFIFNCLNSINRFILVNDTDAASSYLTKFSRLIRMILDGSREDFIPLDQELEALKLYIDMESMRFQERFSWSLNVDPAIQLQNVSVPPLLLQPFVENAIWHGLMQAPEESRKRLMIQIRQRENILTIEISDNGIGRAKASEIKSKGGNKHKSHGVSLTEERLKLMEKVKGVQYKVLIDDNGDPLSPLVGTKVTLQLILNSNPL